MKRTCLTVGFLVLTIFSAIAAPDVHILVTWHSTMGHTEALADAVAKGAATVPGVTVVKKAVHEVSLEDLNDADAVILGSPVINGNIHPKVLAFIGNWPFLEGVMRDKIGAAFCTAGGFSAGEEHVITSIHRAMLIHGMIIVGGPDWQTALGASAIVGEAPYLTEMERGKVDPYFLEKGKGLGRRVAELTLQLKNSPAEPAPTTSE